MNKITFNIKGMHCQSCATSIEKNLNNQSFIYQASVNFATEEAQVVFDNEKINPQDIINIIYKSGYISSIKKSLFDNEKIKLPFKLILIWIIALLFIINMVSHVFFKRIILPIYAQFILSTIVQFILSFNLYKSAYNSIKNKIANMDVLVVLGTTSIWIYSTLVFFYNKQQNIYFDANVMIIAFISMGKFLEEITKKSSLNSIKLIMQLTPKKAKILKNNKWVSINYSDIAINDTLKSNQGERICADGEILKGDAWVDESHLTGESKLIYKTAKDNVLAGSLINEGSLIYKAKTIGEKTFLGDIIKALNEAQGSKANIAKTADKVSTIFVPIVVSISTITFIITYLITKNLQISIQNATSVLVIACPCALGLATPASIMVGLGLATKNGLMFKDAQSMENTAKINTIVFDKTGTLTQGTPKIIDIWINNNKYNKQELLQYTASVEINSNHPIAKTIVNEAQNNNLKLLETKNVKNFIGKGIQAQINHKDVISVGNLEFCNFQMPNNFINNPIINNTMVCVKLNDNVIGIIFLTDYLKNDAKISIEKLNKLGVEIYIMSGDKKTSVDNIAKQLNIPDKNIFSNMSPRNKSQEIEKLINKDKFVAMVGDGINDSPALEKATIGFAMQNGTDIANNTANVILMNNSVEQVYNALLIAKATFKNIKQNLFFAFIYNILAIPLAAIGLLNPIIASISMVLSSITVLFNALRLKFFKI